MRTVRESRFSAMGTTAHIVVVGPGGDALIDRATMRIDELEMRWSRFIPSSEVSHLNSASGRPVRVSTDTVRLVEHGCAAWQLTNGAFDPTMTTQLIAAGYNQSFGDVVTGVATPGVAPGRGCESVTIDREAQTVTLPVGSGFDAGGIGKGLAADMMLAELVDQGAEGAMVNLGGDLAVAGRPPSGDEWIISVREPSISDALITTTRLVDGGLATSTTAKRRWATADGEAHHIIDPATGMSSDHQPVLATVIAGQAWWAEAFATALLASHPSTLDNNESCATLLLRGDGSIERRGDFESYEQ